MGLIRGDDLEEVAVHVILFGWNPERGEGKGGRGGSQRGRVDEKATDTEQRLKWPHSPSGTNSTAVTTDPRRWIEPRGLSP